MNMLHYTHSSLLHYDSSNWDLLKGAQATTNINYAMEATKNLSSITRRILSI
uniref:Uncharacterized protein n=1 Tax=Solanum tuberosum TaxID=4113 RepID=M1APQ6_SOLTU